MRKRIVAMLSMTIALAGCGIVGTWPFAASASPMKGTISGDTYTSQDRIFEVAVPFPADSSEYQQMLVKERYQPHEIYVSLGSAPPHVAFYRVDVVMRATPGSMQPSFDEIAHRGFAKARQEMEQAYGTKAAVVESKETQINGRAAYYWKLREPIPGAVVGTKSTTTVEHDVYAIDFQYAVAMVWVQRASHANASSVGQKPRQFAASLRLLPPVTAASKKLTSDGSYRFAKLPVTVRSPAALCGANNLFAYQKGMGIDFVAPDYLWQIGGDYFAFAVPVPASVTDRKSFIQYIKKADQSFVPDNSKPLGLHFKLASSKETSVDGKPAVQALGIDEQKAVLVTTAVLHRSVITIATLVYPLRPGTDPEAAVPWPCYDKFVSSVRQVN